MAVVLERIWSNFEPLECRYTWKRRVAIRGGSNLVPNRPQRQPDVHLLGDLETDGATAHCRLRNRGP